MLVPKREFSLFPNFVLFLAFKIAMLAHQRAKDYLISAQYFNFPFASCSAFCDWKHWVLEGFRPGLLSAPVEHPRGDFTFTALAPGQGRVAVINTFACPPATVHGCSKPERGNAPSGSPVPSVFTLTVHVK